MVQSRLNITNIQLPLTLLTAAQGSPMLVELKSGDTFNGTPPSLAF